jgi:hypothetical protein
MKLDGYVIVMTKLSPWDEKIKDQIVPQMSYATFGLTPAQAWSNHIRKPIGHIDFPMLVQRWHDRGYRVKQATMAIDYAQKEDKIFD